MTLPNLAELLKVADSGVRFLIKEITIPHLYRYTRSLQVTYPTVSKKRKSVIVIFIVMEKKSQEEKNELHRRFDLRRLKTFSRKGFLTFKNILDTSALLTFIEDEDGSGEVDVLLVGAENGEVDIYSSCKFLSNRRSAVHGGASYLLSFFQLSTHDLF